MTVKLIRIDAIAAKLGGVHESYVWRKIKSDPDAPKPIRLGARLTVFDEADADRWIAGLVAASVVDVPKPKLPSIESVRRGAVKRKAANAEKRQRDAIRADAGAA